MPPADDPLAWLETLAKRQGALDEELITDADLDVPEAEAAVSTGPGYTDFNADRTEPDYGDARADFESEEIQFDIDAIDENIDDWLTAIASGQIDDADSAAEIAAAMAGIEESQSEADDLSTDDIMSALKQGQDVSPDVMSSWMSSMLDAGARRTDVPDYIEEDEPVAAVSAEGEIEEAELPDWLLQQVGAPPPADVLAEPDAEAEDAAAVLESLGALEEIALPPDVEMPDWLRDSLDDAGDSASDDLQRIFADELEAIAEPDILADDEDEESSVATQRVETAELQVDTSDPWVAAFEEERRQGDAIPAWYVERLQALEDGGEDAVSVDEALEALAADASDASEAVIELAAAMLPPERELTPGELMAVPDWLEVDAEADVLEFEAGDEDVIDTPDFAAFMASVEAGGGAEEPALDLPDWLREQAAEVDEVVAPLEDDLATAGGDLPEWLKEAGVSEDEVGPVPEWLIESLGEDSQDVREVTYVPQLITPEPATVPMPAPQTSPAPVIPAAASIDVAAALHEARTKVQTGEIEVSLQSYEAVVRANQQLDEVVNDLSALLAQDVHKKNPTVYRVLGDGLMRQGNLQKALDTYRQALNLL
jgi:tetratricopeptide (TPR) repeat protein